ncbi:MAG: sel1 repeat family protein [Parvibaculum sp.]|nr:sel1 repeat family protein [Parvibaculum sp.]
MDYKAKRTSAVRSGNARLRPGVIAWFAVLAGLVFSMSVGASGAEGLADPSKPDPAIEGAPNEASGEDLYERGFYPEAMAEWKRAVEEKRDAGAAFRLAEAHFDAAVVERNMEEAIKYYAIGAEWGDARAQADLGTLFDKGWGVPQDLAKAAKWYEAAARQGHASAQYNIGVMYEEGAGVEADKVKAYMYYQLAIEGGFPKFATESLENLSATMKPGEIKEATRMARAFKPLTREESAAEVSVTAKALTDESSVE